MRTRPTCTLRPFEVYAAFESAPGGLAASEVEGRRSLYGPNVVSEVGFLPVWRKIAAHAAHPMALVLWGAGLLALLTRQPALPWVIWVVVVINTAFSYWQEHRAERLMAALASLLPRYARVLRDRQEIMIAAEELVPGDVLVLAQGDSIPADARVVEGFGLRVNQTTLTGEAMAVPKTEAASLYEGLTDLERPNLVFAGSSVVSGTGRAVVFATGPLTQLGRLARLTRPIEEAPSPLQQEITHLTRILSLIALGIAAMVFVSGLLDVGLTQGDAFLLAVGILVAVLPEGLRPTLTLSLAMAVQRLSQRGVLVKKLAIMETLGRISVICTDKSGTLTHNQMTVHEVWVAGHRARVTGSGYDPEGSFAPVNGGELLQRDLNALLTIAVLCNNARLLPPGPGRPRWASLGDQTEAALKVCARKGRLDEGAIYGAYPRVHELPFDAARKRMSTIHRNGRSEIAFVKGAPGEVLSQCTHILIDGEERPLDPDTRQMVTEVNDSYARRAMRVLALARRELPVREGAYSPELVERDLTFVGLAAMMDAPRPDVAAAIKTFREAGIRVVIVTGDYGLTAESLARRMGILTTEHPAILTGSEIDTMTDTQLQAVVEGEVIFARVAPEHKLRVVAAFQARGEVVAVSGDGVNDGPALRKADVAIAMGRSGTDVAREAADLVLVEDSFGAIVSAIEEGRTIFKNIRKFITYILASNVPEILPFVLTALFDLPLALGVAQILAIDLGTDLFPALALGAERPEPDVMAQRSPGWTYQLVDQALVTRALWLGVLETLLCYAGFMAVYMLSGQADLVGLPPAMDRFVLPPDSVHRLAATVFFAGVTMGQIGSVFAARRELPGGHRLGWFSNHLLLAAVCFEVGLTLVLIYFRPLASPFGTIPLPAVLWTGLILYGPVLYGLERLRKGLALYVRGRRTAQGEKSG